VALTSVTHQHIAYAELYNLPRRAFQARHEELDRLGLSALSSVPTISFSTQLTWQHTSGGRTVKGSGGGGGWGVGARGAYPCWPWRCWNPKSKDEAGRACGGWGRPGDGVGYP
jgi:hypothetical protein